MTDDQTTAPPAAIEAPKRRGPYGVSARVEKALVALATGTAKSQLEAAKQSNLSTKAIRNALKRPNVREWMSEYIKTTLGLGAMRASQRLVELCESDNAAAAVRASVSTLGLGAGLAMPQGPGSTVHVGVNVLAGYVINLAEPEEAPKPRPASDRAPVTIDHQPAQSSPVHIIDFTPRGHNP